MHKLQASRDKYAQKWRGETNDICVREREGGRVNVPILHRVQGEARPRKSQANDATVLKAYTVRKSKRGIVKTHGARECHRRASTWCRPYIGREIIRRDWRDFAV